MIELVIFDCDGVLVDSEPIANRVFARLLAAHGLALTPEDVMRTFIALTAAGLMPLLEGRLFSAAQVPRPKPAPDLFLHAAKTMGFEPGACAVIEDTVTGVKAAVAAGMRAFGYAGAPHTDGEALEAHGAAVFRNMRSLPSLLEEA